jgi:toxin FitB
LSYLVDANVLSEPTRPDPDPGVVSWLRTNERELTIDPVILGEIRFGILLLPQGQRRQRLERWFDEGARRMHCLPWELDRILPGALRRLPRPLPRLVEGV